jgi:hypothetical protein
MKKAAERKKPVPKNTLTPGLHVGIVEMGSGETFRVRTRRGARVRARLDEDVSRELIESCLKTGQRVLVLDDGDGPVIVGAIETKTPPSDRPVILEGKDIRLRATDSLTLEVGESTLRMEKAGLMRLEGNRLVVDVAALMRVLSARVELP